MKKKPSDYAGIYPFSCILRNSECEDTAHNIMKILKRTGDTFRKLTWKEYYEERLKDLDSDKMVLWMGKRIKILTLEKKYFDEVVGFCKSEGTARLFSKKWDLK
jgi:hypothetical protein